jgi:hypothetical protein
MTNPEHARILADIASQVVRQYTTGSGRVPRWTSDPNRGQVPVPANAVNDQHTEDWDWTLEERYRP